MGNWSRYRRFHSKNSTDFCKVWIGIKWDPKDSKFKYESNNKTLAWSNFKHPENNLGDPDQCNYRIYDKNQSFVLR